jgi:selenocysteine-specific elongation factor
VRVRVHLGTAEVLARVQVLESGGEISPGSFGLAQLRLETPVIALPGERFIVRSYSPSTTIAGGRVLDPFAVKHRGRELSIVRARLTTLTTAGKIEQLAHHVTATGKIGLGRMDLAQRTAWTDRILNDVVRQAVQEGVVVDAGDAYISRASFNSLAEATTEAVEKHHAREPLSRGLSRETLRERLFASTSPGIFRAVLSELEDSGIIASEKEIVRAGSHSLKLSPVDSAIKVSLDAQYREAAMEPPQLDEALARASNSRASPAHARAILQLLIDDGTLVRVDKDLLFHKDALDRLLVQIREYAATHERLIDIGSFKNLAGVSRKYAIPLLEYLDRQHVTRRAGDKRVIL